MKALTIDEWLRGWKRKHRPDDGELPSRPTDAEAWAQAFRRASAKAHDTSAPPLPDDPLALGILNAAAKRRGFASAAHERARRRG